MEQYTYLLLNIFTISIPLALSFEHKLHFYKKWKFYLPSLLLTAVFFLLWDYFKTRFGVWQFSNQYTMGVRFWGLPIEEYLFFFTVPYACTFIYETVSYYIKQYFLPSYITSVSWFISFTSLITSFFFLDKSYTWSVLFGLAFIMPIIIRVLPGMQFQSFVIMFIISLLPMAFVNGVLTSMPVVIYNNAENLGIRAYTIPVEDFVYSFIMLGMNVGLYEYIKLKFTDVKSSSGSAMPLVQFF